MNAPQFDEHVLYHDSTSCRLGSLSLIVSVDKAPGVTPAKPLRIYGHYATVYITRGHGRYSDANGHECAVSAGDIIFVFPELPHVYAPDSGTDWDEIYTIFDGPVFDSWRSLGMLEPAVPIVKGLPASEWLSSLTTIAGMATDGSQNRKAMQICRFLELLAQVIGASQRNVQPQSPAVRWVSRACRLLAAGLGDHSTIEQIAERMEMTADSFRKRFKKETTLSPQEYRTRKRIEAACQLLLSTTMTHTQIASRLGFTDEFHFSKRFHQIIGQPPRDFRKKRIEQDIEPDLPLTTQHPG